MYLSNNEYLLNVTSSYMFNICILSSRGCTMQLWRNYFNILLLPANSYYNWGVGQDSTGEDRTGEATLCHMRVWWQFPPREPRIISHICRHAASSALDMPPKIYYTTKNMWGRGTVAEEQMTKMIHWLKIVKCDMTNKARLSQHKYLHLHIQILLNWKMVSVIMFL